MRKFGVAGLGLIGGSVALALKNNGFYVVGSDVSDGTLSYALKSGIIDQAAVENGFIGCEIIFVCVPLNFIRETAERIYEEVGDSAIITDVASVKGILKGAKGRIVGGHPMAGTEHSGITAAKSHLFENAYYLLVPYENTLSSDLEKVKDIVKLFKARPVVLSAEQHDAEVAKISHLPHMVAYSLVLSTLSGGDGLAGSGFMDTTRIAASDPAFWTEITKLNRENILSEMDKFSQSFDKLKRYIKDGDYKSVELFMSQAKEKRDALKFKKAYISEYSIDVDIKDEVGSIYKLSKMLADAGINISSIQIINSREGAGGALRIGITEEPSYKKALGLLAKEGEVK